MGRPVVIVGVGGMGREAAAWIADAGDGDDLLGFLDADTAVHGTRVGGLPVLGGIEWFEERHAQVDGKSPMPDGYSAGPHRVPVDDGDVEVVVAIGSPTARTQLVRDLEARGVGLRTVVHPSAQIGPRVVIGSGAIISPGVVLTCDITIGRAAIVNYGAMIGHDGDIGAAAFVAPGVNLAGNVTVGERADIGIGASVIQGVRIGEDAVVGAGAVVIRDVDPGTTVVGVPARPLRRGDAPQQAG